MGSIASAVGGLVGGIGGMISGDAAAGAANEQADYLRNLSAEQRKAITDAAATAAARGQFKPVTVTSSFGTPQYTYDASGRLTGVSSTPAPWLADLQARQQGLLPQYMGLTESALSAAPQYAAGAQRAVTGGERMYGLAEQALPTSYDTTAATQKLYSQYQDLLAPERERQLATTRQGLFNTGRTGLATGATQAGGMLATNPEMAAYYNAVAQKDKELAIAAEEKARANLQSDIATAGKLYAGGAGGYTTAGDLQNQLYRNVAASQTPFATGMAATTGLESTAYTPVTQGFSMATPVSQGEQYAGTMQYNAANAAANVAAQYAQPIANYQYQNSAYSPWGSLLQGMGGTLGQSNLGSWSSLFGNSGPVGPQISNAAYNSQDAYAARLNAAAGF
jgi:YD repeat-containing protein